MAEPQYRVVTSIYDGDTLIAQGVGHLPNPLPGDRENIFESAVSHLHKEDESTVHLYASTTITRTVVD